MAVTSIDVEVVRPRPGSLVLRYVLTGKIDDLRLPSAAAAARADELWRHTCFEAFVRAAPSTAYYEFNFAPSTQWAAYRFGAYRSEMSAATEVGAPRIETRLGDGLYTLEAVLDLDATPMLPSDVHWRLGLSAVVEEASGRKSYWALAHPPGKADFHHADGFAHDLPAA